VLTVDHQPLFWEVVTLDDATDTFDFLNHWHREHPGLQIAPPQVHVFYTVTDTLLMPAAMEDPGNPELLLKELFGATKTVAQVQHDDWSDPQARLYYRVPVYLQAWMTEKYPTHVQAHALSRLFAAERAEGVTIVLLPGLALIAFQEGGQLKLAQVYPYQTAEDLSWYLLQAAHSFGASPETVVVRLDGFVTPDAAVFDSLHKFIRQVEIEVRSAKPASMLPDQLPAQYFSPLFSMLS
jgi:hypothetical protein